jgi:NADPH:quinone reductase-like Zn-dependent oxidoreductase
VAIPTRRLAPIPDEVDDVAASCLPVAGLTAMAALAHGGLLLGRTVLITAAAGGVGRMALQLARLAGARVIASVGDERRTRALDGLGVEAVEIGVEPDGPDVDVVLESIGGPTFAAAVARLTPGGTMVTIGASSDTPSTMDVLRFVRTPGVTIRGISLFDELERQGRGARDLAILLDLVAAGRLDPGVDRVADWSNMAELLTALEERRVAGKAVARVG